MKEKINIAELLKDCPKGMELDCTIYDNVTLEIVFESCLYPIQIQTPEGLMSLTKYGSLSSSTHSKCVIFPKGKTTWEGFVPPCQFKDGDIIYVKDKYNRSWCSIMNNCKNEELYTYVDYCIDNNSFYFGVSNSLCYYKNVMEHRLATEEEKQKLFDAIKTKGYKWNAETKTLEELIVPKFKVGDRIILKNSQYNIPSIRINAVIDGQYILENGGFLYIDSTDEKYVLENKFDINTLIPFESRVLVRNVDGDLWKPAIYGFSPSKGGCYVVGGIYWKQCIPYEGNQHLRGKTDDCDDFYKNWN